METYITGTAPATTWHYKGTLAEIQAVPGPEGSLGHPTDSRLEQVYQGGVWKDVGAGQVDATGNTAFGGAVSAAGDGGIQGAFLGTFDDEASLPASATPGALATTRDGKSYVFAAVV